MTTTHDLNQVLGSEQQKAADALAVAGKKEKPFFEAELTALTAAIQNANNMSLSVGDRTFIAEFIQRG